jgi:hypothetical protein
MGRPLKIKMVSETPGPGVDIGFNGVGTLTAAVVPAGMSGTEYFGVVGGRATGVATSNYPTVKCRVKIGTNAEADGVIIRQKGASKYLVSDGTNTGICFLANKADGALANGEMNIQLTAGDSTLVNIARLTNKYALDYSNIRYVVNFFDDGTQIKSGTTGAANQSGQQNIVTLGIVEQFVS